MIPDNTIEITSISSGNINGLTISPYSDDGFIVNISTYRISKGNYYVQFNSDEYTGHFVFGIFVKDLDIHVPGDPDDPVNPGDPTNPDNPQGTINITPVENLPTDLTSSIQSGTINLSEALGTTYSAIDNLIDNADSLLEQQLYTSYGNDLVNKYITVSNNLNVQSLTSDGVLNSQLQEVLDDFKNDDISYQDAVIEFGNIYQEAIDNSSTPDDVNSITIYYNEKYEELRYEYETKVSNEYNNLISDDEKETITDYESLEDDIFEELGDLNLDEIFQDTHFFDEISLSEKTQLKNILSWFYSDSFSWSFFCMVPLYLTLIAILLGTSLRTKK